MNSSVNTQKKVISFNAKTVNLLSKGRRLSILANSQSVRHWIPSTEQYSTKALRDDDGSFPARLCQAGQRNGWRQRCENRQRRWALDRLGTGTPEHTAQSQAAVFAEKFTAGWTDGLNPSGSGVDRSSFSKDCKTWN